ncbi:MAG: FG-GAP-like repeat-containing protein, partial [Myxococcota bacterium]
MHRMRALPFLLFAACAPEPTGSDTFARVEPARAGAPLPAGATEDWAAVVQTRLAAEARAITPRAGAFGADLRAVGLTARFDADAVTIGDALSLRTTAWGRPDALVPVGARTPRLGACTTAVDARDQCIPRLEYADAGLTEWWIGLDDGLEQGWTIDAAPGGDGPLTLDVTVEGALAIDGATDARIDGRGDEAALTDGDGRAWTVSALTAWDADGLVLPAWLVVTDEGLRIEVDDTGAVYPLTVDPIYATATTTLEGEAYTGALGSDVDIVGDVNGDGYADAIVGAYTYATYTGRALVYHGTPTGLETTATTTLTGTAEYDLFGTAVAGAGDVDGDGYADVVVGAYGAEADAGRVYVHHGSAAGVSETATTTLTGASAAALGCSVAGAGDVDGDGYADILVGAAGSAIPGEAYVHHGSAAGVSTTATTTLTVSGLGVGDRYATSLSGAGDVDGDGYDDVIVGAYAYDMFGRAWVHHGSASGVSASAATTLTGTAVLNEQFGYSVSRAGDVDGDGYDDLIVSAPAIDTTRVGHAYVFHGSATGIATTATTTFTGASRYYKFGQRVAGGGDVDGDGYDDVLVAAPAYTSATGQVYVFHGSAAGVSPTATTTVTGEATSSYYGLGVSIGGDVTGDGYDDLLVGAYYYESQRGRVYLYPGSTTGVDTTAITTLTGSKAPGFGHAVASAGDVDADGFADVIVGSYTEDGRAYLFHGAAGGLSTTATTTLEGDADSLYFGIAVAGAGDLDADGYADVVVGESLYSSFTGRVWVFPGSATGVDTSAVTTILGPAFYSYFGQSLAAAGDVDADGYGDLIVGAYSYGSQRGRFSVFHGSASGVSSTAATTVDGAIRSQLGYAVAGAGDVDADGYDDVIVGAPEDSDSYGRAFVFHGSPTGIGATATTTFAGATRFAYLGRAVAGAGDVDGDGYADVIVGAPAGQPDYPALGEVLVFHGSATGVPTTATTTLTGEAPNDLFGNTLAGAGDLDHDGYSDIVVSAYEHDSSTGRVYVYAGSAAGLGTTAAITLTGEATSNSFGRAIAASADVDGDGWSELLVGARGWDHDLGRVYVYAVDEEGGGEDSGDSGGVDTGAVDTGAPVDTDTGESVDTDTGASVDTDTGAPVDTDTVDTAVSVDTGEPVDTDTGAPVDTDMGASVDTDTGAPVDTDTGESVDTDTGEPVDTDTGGPVDTDTGDPDTTDTDTDTDTAEPVDTDTD